jgi:8-oxo-dGTP pyrophosphatase MutT (NUDIX family)
VTRPGPVGLEVLLVHRPRYDDWTFPKGKARDGESDEHCAVREVAEETGLRCALEEELPGTAYRDGKGRDKRVRYWSMRALEGSARAQNEIDAVEWLRVGDARRRLSYERDRAVLEVLAAPGA